MQDVMKALDPEKQSSSIDPTVDNIIKGEKGTQIFIPANALRFKDGSIPTGKVNIELKEFFSTSDFISNNLSTVSDSFLLETNGMLYISATADGKELVVDNSKSYTIAFPKSDSTRNMELFYGDSTQAGSINWNTALPTTEGFGIGYDSLLVDSALYKYKVRICGYMWMNAKETGWTINHPDSNAWIYFKNNFNLPSNLEDEIKKAEQFLEVKIFINEQGKIYKAVLRNNLSPELKMFISNFFMNMPAFNMRSPNYFYPELEYKIMLCGHEEFDQEKYAERFKQKYIEYKDKAIEKMDKGELGIYVFSATKFGWINCDRFYFDEREKIDFIVKAPSAEAKTFIVFENINSIMSGNYNNGNFVFPNVPIDSKVKVIAINFENGKPKMAVQQNTVTKNAVSISNFKDFTITELEKQLNKS